MDQRSPYVQQWNLSIQREFKGGVIDVRYVGNRSTKQFRAFDYNQVQVKNNGFLADFKKALDTLPDDQREAIILIGASGFSYEEAADICGCAVGTMKSRVSRARSKLQEAADRQLEKDRTAFKAMRQQGIQPARLRGAAELQDRASTVHEIETGRIWLVVDF